MAPSTSVMLLALGCAGAGYALARATEKPVVEDSGTAEIAPHLHWDESQERRGIGKALVKLNHVGLIVSDVGRSAAFYSEILGLQQLRRPNFDRHGAWFTMGNVELHLIKGVPLVPDGTNLIVGHLSIESDCIDVVLQRLIALKVPFEKNVSVPSGKGKGLSEGGNMNNTVVQYFIRDPDGYYLELCNCDVLTKFCFNQLEEDRHHHMMQYEEGVRHVPVANILVAAAKLVQKAFRAKRHVAHFDELLHSLDEELLGPPATEVDTDKWDKLSHRRLVYGDITQCVSEDELRQTLLRANNCVPTCMLLLAKIAKERGHHYQPPAYFRSQDVGGLTGDKMYKPPVLDMHDNAQEATA